jgi:hypothetical protein
MKNETISKISNFIVTHKIRLVFTFIILILSTLLIVTMDSKTKMEKENLILNDSIKNRDNIIDSLNVDIDSMRFENDSLRKEIAERKDINRFMRAIAMRESNGNYKVINQYGMMGLYQFSPNTLSLLGICYEDYLSSIEIQDQAMISYLRYNRSILNKYIIKYDGKRYKGIKITASGILAGAHLTGPGGIIEFFDDSNNVYKEYDGNNVHVSEYIEDFGGYDILTSL